MTALCQPGLGHVNRWVDRPEPEPEPEPLRPSAPLWIPHPWFVRLHNLYLCLIISLVSSSSPRMPPSLRLVFWQPVLHPSNHDLAEQLFTINSGKEKRNTRITSKTHELGGKKSMLWTQENEILSSDWLGGLLWQRGGVKLHRDGFGFLEKKKQSLSSPGSKLHIKQK